MIFAAVGSAWCVAVGLVCLALLAILRRHLKPYVYSLGVQFSVFLVLVNFIILGAYGFAFVLGGVS